MTIFKCKICGGSLEIDGTQSVATCEYCGTKQTLPKLDNERRANLYDRANHFRRNNDFDKAMGIYENILNEDNTDAEAYWSIVLCRYGIEYVEDPATHKRVPTVNRAQFTSIFDDEDYKSAIANADGYQREIYEAEATAINEIQKGILAISQKEEPFDVFICYKETDASGRRTQDSVLATELYHELTREGFKVFFSRITLEDKLGVAYEPYIFAALHSAKVMVVLGTRSEHFNAVWVKNEWSRYLALIKNGAKKTLIPAYRDMDPYDLPEEFSHLQAQDMSKLGFMQDLIRGIKKIAEIDAPQANFTEAPSPVAPVVPQANFNITPILKRVFMFLEDGDWKSADEYCEKVLDQDPENTMAYLGKLMVNLRVKKEEELVECKKPFDSNGNYQKAIRFADDDLRAKLKGYNDRINTRIKNAELDGIYRQAVNLMKMANSDMVYKQAARMFDQIKGYKDSVQLAQKCYEFAEEKRKDSLLCLAKSYFYKNYTNRKNGIYNCHEAIRILEPIRSWRDAEKLIAECLQKIEKLKQEIEEKRIKRQRRVKRFKKFVLVAIPLIAFIVVGIVVLNTFIIPNNKYNSARALMDEGKYSEAISVFGEIHPYQDSGELIKECNYNQATNLMNSGNFYKAYFCFWALGGYKDSLKKSSECIGYMLCMYVYHKDRLNWCQVCLRPYYKAGDIHMLCDKCMGEINKLRPNQKNF